MPRVWRDGGLMCLSDDQQKVLWSEQSASISRLIARVENLEQLVGSYNMLVHRVRHLEKMLKEMNAEMMGEVP